MKHRLLLNPGPVEVHPDILKAMSVPMISHRGREYKELHAGVREKVRKFLGTKGHIFFLTSSGTGAMEATMRNLTREHALVTTCGAFSERWFDIAKANGRAADTLAVEWGRAVRPDIVEKALAARKYDLVTVTWNETSTGVMSPLADLAKAIKRHPGVLLAVDAVSILAGAPVDIDGLGIDFIFAGVQKAFGLPPGLAVAVASDAALERAEQIVDRGYYFDLVKYAKMDADAQTPETPSISHIHALGVAMDRALTEGVENRYARIAKMAERCRTYAREKFALYPEPGYESVTLTVLRNTRQVKPDELVKAVAERGVTIAGGYGKLKDSTFRIAHMGDIQPADVEHALGCLDDALGQLERR